MESRDVTQDRQFGGFKIRVYELARELGKDNREMEAQIRELGIAVHGVMSTLEADDAERVRRHIHAKPEHRRVEPAQPAAPTPATEKPGAATVGGRIQLPPNTRRLPGGLTAAGERPGTKPAQPAPTPATAKPPEAAMVAGRIQLPPNTRRLPGGLTAAGERPGPKPAQPAPTPATAKPPEAAMVVDDGQDPQRSADEVWQPQIAR